MDTQATIIFLQQCTSWLEKIATAKQKELYYSLEKQASQGKVKGINTVLQNIKKFLFGAKNTKPAGSQPTKVQAASEAQQGNPSTSKAQTAPDTAQGNNPSASKAQTASEAQQGNTTASEAQTASDAATEPGWFSRHPVVTAATLGAAGGGALTYAMTPSKRSEPAYINASNNTNPTAVDLTSYYGIPSNNNPAATAFVNSYYGSFGR